MRENKKNLFLRKMLLNLRFSTAISSSITYVYWFAQSLGPPSAATTLLRLVRQKDDLLSVAGGV